MLERILTFSVSHRYFVVLLTLGVAGAGVVSLTRLTIDAVPDITNKQVQINTPFPALSPVEVEKQITFPIETALAGIPGLEYTRSLSRLTNLIEMPSSGIVPNSVPVRASRTAIRPTLSQA